MRVNGKTRKLFLVLHIVAISAWIGIDVVVGVLVFTARFTDSAATAALAYQALGMVAVWPMASAGLASLITGVVLGLGTKYGLVRYWWVGIKLVMNLVLTTLVLVLLRPGIAQAAAYGRELAQGSTTVPLPEPAGLPADSVADGADGGRGAVGVQTVGTDTLVTLRADPREEYPCSRPGRGWLTPSWRGWWRSLPREVPLVRTGFPAPTVRSTR